MYPIIPPLKQIIADKNAANNTTNHPLTDVKQEPVGDAHKYLYNKYHQSYN